MLLVGGCVKMTSSANYVPQNGGTALNFYACQQLNSEYNGVDYARVRACMESRNYRLIEAPPLAVAIEVLTFPLWFPLDIVSGGWFSSDMGAGDGKVE
jgi:hypothetical protein